MSLKKARKDSDIIMFKVHKKQIKDIAATHRLNDELHRQAQMLGMADSRLSLKNQLTASEQEAVTEAVKKSLAKLHDEHKRNHDWNSNLERYRLARERGGLQAEFERRQEEINRQQAELNREKFGKLSVKELRDEDRWEELK